MGFLSKLMKNPMAQMALPMALSWAMPAMGITSYLSQIQNPMLRSAIEQSMIGYTRAKLMRDKHPGRSAMYAGLGSMPFSFMKGQAAANQFNKQYYGDVDAKDLFKTAQGPEIMTDRIPGYWDEPSSDWIKAIESKGTGKYGASTVPDLAAMEAFKKEGPMTAWDVIGGKGRNVPEMRNMAMTGQGKPIWSEEAQAFAWPKASEWDTSGATIGGGADPVIPEVDFYSKVGKGGRNLLGQELIEGETYTDWLPTIGSQTAGWIGGQPDADERWEEKRMANRKMMAEMYGIPEHLLGGLMENPYYRGGGFWKDGGIASLQMDNGGAVDGPGGPKDDVIDAKLSDGEFVMTAKAVENLGGGNRLAGAKQMYNMMNQLDPQSETVGESVIGV